MQTTTMQTIKNFIAILTVPRSERARIRAGGYRVTVQGLWTSEPRVTLVERMRRALWWRSVQRQPPPKWTAVTMPDGRKALEWRP